MKPLSFSRGLPALLAVCVLAGACGGDGSDPAPTVSGNGSTAASGDGSADPGSSASGAGSADPESVSSDGGAGQEPAASGDNSADSDPVPIDGEDGGDDDDSGHGDSSGDDSGDGGGDSDGGEDASGTSDDSDGEGGEDASSSDSSGGPPVVSAGEEIPAVEMGADPTLPGPYAVGAASAFVHDPSRPFDPWGARYKSPGVRAVIAEVRAAGDPQIVPVEIHYPVEAAPDAVVSTAVQPARVAPAADPNAVRATNLDYFHGDRALYDSAFSPRLGVEEVEAEDRRSFLNAPGAEGRFPVVVLSHGGGGTGRQWTAAAEHLASHGYVVVSPSHISDSSSSLVFHDPDSAYMAGLGGPGPAAATAAEARFGADEPIFRNFFELGWGGPPPLDPRGPNAIEGGAAAVAVMMGEMFQQRVDDIAAVLAYLDALSAPAAECQARLGPDGAGGGGDRAPRCGAFEGAIDTGRVGVMGHSLGSITSQVASVQIEAVRAAVGLTTGLPSTWEPGGGFPDASGDPNRPDGVTKPVAFLSGAEDGFLNYVFSTLWTDAWTGSGGDPG